jgi:nucleoid-associated protein YgaU
MLARAGLKLAASETPISDTKASTCSNLGGVAPSQRTPKPEQSCRTVCATGTCATVVLPDPAKPGQDSPPMSASPTHKATDAKSPTQTHVVKRGDTLFKIAKQYCGDGSKWTKIQKANPQIKDPGKLKVGEKLTIPG